ncbi:MAG: hypothetical protein Q8906_10805 [Bacillota bacterium]|nr:hypothetical protein [Bacillota bacterium]
MIIVYLSIGLVVASLIFLGLSAVKTIKETKPSINELNHMVVRVQKKTDTIKMETTKLSQNQQKLIADINFKKHSITFTVASAKQAFNSFKRLWKIKPLSIVVRKKRKMNEKLTSIHLQT